LAGNRTREKDGGSTERSKTDDYAHRLYYLDTDFDVVDRVKALAAAKEVKPAQIALAWILQRPRITAPIVGASKLGQLDDAIAGMKVQLTPQEAKSLEEPYRPHAILDHQ
jgi:aryl-alcohol dehydrogenase (NADP+)